MNNVLNFTVAGDKVSGVEGETLYLGTAIIEPWQDMTSGLRAFNLPNAIAPGDWRNACSCCPDVIEQIKRWEMQQPLC